MYSKKDEDGKIIEYGYWKFPYGYNFYGYISKDSKGEPLLLSAQMAEYFKEVHEEYGGYGNVSAVMDSHRRNFKSKSSHLSGNCADLGLAVCGNSVNKIKDFCIPLLKHQATVMVYLEAKTGDTVSESLSKSVINAIKQGKINTDKICFRYESSASGFHIHFQINPYLLKKVPLSKKDYGF